MDKRYTIIIKTGDAEIRALENTSKLLLSRFLPVIEITRGRKITRDGNSSYPFEKRLSKLKKIFERQTVCFDLTSDEALSSSEIDYLYKPDGGYKNWLNFLIQIKKENIFEEVIPTILLNLDDDDFEKNLVLQIQNLKLNFNTILYRNSITDENCYDDFELLKSELIGFSHYVLIDCGYTPQASYINVAQKTIARINNIKSIVNNSSQFIVCSTSFPNNISELGDKDNDTFSISEIDIFKEIGKTIQHVCYGDYASINPVRNDTIVMARGWIPRIDIPLNYLIYYYRKRRPKGITAYANTYIQVAKLVTKDVNFPVDIPNNWGIKQVINCANGQIPSSSPSFWISVRMNIHIEQQIRRIYY